MSRKYICQVDNFILSSHECYNMVQPCLTNSDRVQWQNPMYAVTALAAPTGGGKHAEQSWNIWGHQGCPMSKCHHQNSSKIYTHPKCMYDGGLENGSNAKCHSSFPLVKWHRHHNPPFCYPPFVVVWCSSMSFVDKFLWKLWISQICFSLCQFIWG